MIICLLATSLLIEAARVSNGLLLPVPQLKNAYGNSKSQTIHVLWTDATSIIGNVTYDIEVYNPAQKEAVHRDSVEKRANLTVTHDWHWVSLLPLECLRHSVRLRVRNVSSTSEWTELRGVTGSGSDHSLVRIYPKDDTAKVGSRKKFCCIIPEGSTLQDFQYERISMLPNYTQVNQTYIFEIAVKASKYSGDHLYCLTEKENTKYTTVLYGGYSPEVHNFTCSTRSLSLLECSWTQGNDNNLRSDRRTTYILNGSPCNIYRYHVKPLKKCSITITAEQWDQVTWTLTATNMINTTNFIYTFNPRHRVYLESPQDPKVEDIKSRNASLKWRPWPHANLSTLPMQCQVEINSNRKTEVREGGGVGLHSITLHDLHPYTRYSGRVRCASAEYFWKWGDWSKEFTFQTKEDIPQAVDLWMGFDNNNISFVLWKQLSAEQSHGELKRYNVSWDGSVRGLEPSKNCLNMSKKDVGKMINVTALNSVGHSSPSTVKIPSPPGDMKTARVNSSDGTLQLSWTPRLNASCGYVVDWYPVGRRKMCDIDWIKIPAGHTNVTIKSVLKVGMRYTFSLYACTSDAPELLQRWEGYGQENVSVKVPNFHGEQDGMNVRLTWTEIPLEQRNGFIQRYEIHYFLADHNKGPNKTKIVGSQEMQTEILNLSPHTYKFQIRAFTSKGPGENATTTVTLTPRTVQIIAHSIMAAAIVIILAVLCAILCYRKRARLKDLLYPDIPAPQLGSYTLKGIHDFQLLEILKENVEPMMACDLVTEDQLTSASYITESNFTGPYLNVADSDANLTPCDADCSLDSAMLAVNNYTYSPLAVLPESHFATPVTPEGYKPQELSAFSPLLPSSDPYQVLEDGNQPTINGGNFFVE